MTKEEIQASIKSIMFSGSVCGIEIYACLRDESGYQTKKIRATDKLLSSTKDKVAGFINCTYLADDAEFDTSENIADNKKEFYEISLIENYRPFIFLDDAEKRTEYYSESDRNKLSGFLFRINLNDKYFWVYQHIYSVSRIDRSKNVIALFVGDTYDEIDSDIVQIDSRADVIIFSSSVVTAKMDLMQRFFGFEQYIRAGAQKTIEIIRDLDIVDIRYPDIRFRLLIPVGKCYAENTFCRFKLWRGWSILICTFNFFDFCAITFNQSHPGEDSRKVRISRL